MKEGREHDAARDGWVRSPSGAGFSARRPRPSGSDHDFMDAISSPVNGVVARVADQAARAIGSVRSWNKLSSVCCARKPLDVPVPVPVPGVAALSTLVVAGAGVVVVTVVPSA